MLFRESSDTGSLCTLMNRKGCSDFVIVKLHKLFRDQRDKRHGEPGRFLIGSVHLGGFLFYGLFVNETFNAIIDIVKNKFQWIVIF